MRGPITLGLCMTNLNESELRKRELIFYYYLFGVRGERGIVEGRREEEKEGGDRDRYI